MKNHEEFLQQLEIFKDDIISGTSHHKEYKNETTRMMSQSPLYVLESMISWINEHPEYKFDLVKEFLEEAISIKIADNQQIFN